MGLLDTLKNLVVGTQEQPVPVLRRNDICWCNSGKKYKNCHLAADERKRSAQRASGLSSPAGRAF